MSLGERDAAALRDLEEVLTLAADIVSEGRAAFVASDERKFTCLAPITRVGEIARGRLSPEYREHHPDIPWSDIIAMRNVVTHEYDIIDYGMVWDAMAQEMAGLRDRLVDDIEVARTHRDVADDGRRDVEQNQARELREAGDELGRSAPAWEPDVPRCGSTDTEDDRACRNPAPPDRRCWRHRK